MPIWECAGSLSIVWSPFVIRKGDFGFYRQFRDAQFIKTGVMSATIEHYINFARDQYIN